MPLSDFRRIWQYISIRADDDDLINPALWTSAEPTVKSINSMLGVR